MSNSEGQHSDVLIVGAGLSGIGAACRLETELPGASYAILEARGSSGGTWDLFRFPGVRSDSDMFTLGFPFRPWPQPRAIAPGADILALPRETAAEYGVDSKISYHAKVIAADWSAAAARWTRDRAGHRHRCPVGTHVQLPLPVLGLLQLRRRATRPTGRAWPASAARSCTRKSGQMTST